MTEITEYIMRVVTVCIVCSIIIHLSKGFKISADLIKVTCGILVAITAFTPLLQLRWNNLTDYMDKMKNDARIIASNGSELYYQQREESIRSQLEAYILDKAESYNCRLQVEVELSSQDPPIPVRVILQGSVSPYQKTQLSNMIANDLGIPKEMQSWNGFQS